MGIYRQFPYTNFHDINLDWILERLREYMDLTDLLEKNIIEFEGRVEIDIENFKNEVNADIEGFKEYVTTYLENLSVPEEVRKILDEWLDEGIFDELLTELVDKYMEEVVEAQKRLLTSNDIDVENLYSYVFNDSRGGDVSGAQYPVFQAIVVSENGYFITVSNDERPNAQNPSNRCKLREYNSAGVFQREAYVDGGHCNGMTYKDGQIFIAWMSEWDGSSWVSTNKITVVNYPSFLVDRIITVDNNIRAIAYNQDKDQFITCGGDYYYIYNNDLTELITTFTLPTSFSADQGLQDIFYYNNYVGVICSYPNLIAFYDLDSHELVKYYNPTQRISNSGVPFNEIESAYVYDHKIYMCGFARLDNQKSYSNIAVMDPWKNVKTDYVSKNRYSGLKTIYVDGNYNGAVQTGEESTPFSHIMLAIAAIKSSITVTNAVQIACKRGTNVGALLIHEITSVPVIEWGDGEEKYIINGLRMNMCSNMLIRNAKIIYNDNASTGTAAGYIVNSKGIRFVDCELSSTEGVASENSIGLYAGNQSEVEVVSIKIGNGYSVGMQANAQSVITAKGTNSISAPTRVRTVAQSQYHSGLKFKPADQRYRFESMAISTRPWVHVYSGTFGDVGNANLNNDAYISDIAQGITEVCIETSFGSSKTKHFINIPNDTGTSTFNLMMMNKFTHLWTGSVFGNIDLVNKKIYITEQASINQGTGDYYMRTTSTATGIAYVGITGVWVR